MQLYNYGGGSFQTFSSFSLHILGKINSQFIGNLDSHVWLAHIFATISSLALSKKHPANNSSSQRRRFETFFFQHFLTTRRPQVKVKVKKHHNHTRCRKPKQNEAAVGIRWPKKTWREWSKSAADSGGFIDIFFWLKTVCWSETCWIMGSSFFNRSSEYWIDGTSTWFWPYHFVIPFLGGGNSNIFHFHSYLGKMNPIWRAYFSGGLKLKPPASFHCVWTKHPEATPQQSSNIAWQCLHISIKQLEGKSQVTHRFGYHPNDHKLYMAGSFRRNRSFRVAPFWIHKLYVHAVYGEIESGSCVFNLFNPTQQNLLQRIFGFKINFGNSHHLTLSSIAYQ